jgi:hypothetical protein
VAEALSIVCRLHQKKKGRSWRLHGCITHLSSTFLLYELKSDVVLPNTIIHETGKLVKVLGLISLGIFELYPEWAINFIFCTKKAILLLSL